MPDTRDFTPVLEDIGTAIRAYKDNGNRLTKAEAAVKELRRERAELQRRLLTIDKAATELRTLAAINPVKKNAVAGKTTAHKENPNGVGHPVEG